MANRYWVSTASAPWNATAGTKWATTSGGAGGASVPTAADDVFFDANSLFACQVSGARVARSVNCTGFTGTLAFLSGSDLSLGDGTAGAGNIAAKFVPGMTLTLSGGTLTFVSTSATQQTVATGGKTMPATTFNGVGGSWLLNDTFFGSTMTLTNGSLSFGTQNVTLSASFLSNNTNTRTLNLGTGTLTLNVGSTWQIDGTNLTALFTNSTIVQNATADNLFYGGGKSYGTVAWSFGAFGAINRTTTITGSNTFINLSSAHTGGTSNAPIYSFPASATQTVTGYFGMTGGAGSLAIVKSSVAGTRSTINVPDVSNNVHDYINIQDMAFTGEGKQFATNSVDSGNNAEIRMGVAMPARQALLGCGI